MPYERWSRIARERSVELALCEVSSGRRWSFADLVRAADDGSAVAGTFVFARGRSAEFVLTVLRAWRAGAVLCPLDPGQPEPAFPVPPAPCRHLRITSATTRPGARGHLHR
jgi:acyl-CoA synthetase (AMP-forming)/AMP-acid ligase II